jgi:ABC-2 type transport system ATP-binding protein
MFQAINLTKSYKQKVVLSGLSLEVLRGELFFLLGGKGSGKSTAVDLFLNLTRPTSGNCMIGGFNVALHPMKPKALLAYVPPSLPLYDELTGAENLQYFSTMAGFEELKHADIARLFKELGIPQELVDQRASTYSVDVRQRIGLAIAVARDAKALLLDDPTAQMDEDTAEHYATLVRQYAVGDITGEPAAVLMATSSAELAAEYGHKVGLLRNGKLLEVLEADELAPGELAEICAEHMKQ